MKQGLNAINTDLGKCLKAAYLIVDAHFPI